MTNLNRVIFPIFSPSVAQKVFSRDGGNPGCGGTQFVAIMLAIRLAEALPDAQVELINEDAFEIIRIPSNLRITKMPLREACAYLKAGAEGGIAIVPTALLETLVSFTADLPAQNIIGWIHHPFHLSRSLRRMNLAAHVSVGAAQYFSNAPFYPRHWHIPNLFNFGGQDNAADEKTVDREAPVFVFLGAMVPGKGLHHVLDNWRALLRRFPRAKLHVIGGSATYSMSVQPHPVLPCSRDYGDRLLRNLPVDEIGVSVIIHGNLGAEKIDIIRQAHIALLNPTGRSEAFPASPLECLALGTPVVASDDFGMQDVMRHFPEATLTSSGDIVRVAAEIIEDPELYRSLRARGRAVASYYENRSDDIVHCWIRLIRKSLNDDPGSLPPYTSCGLPAWKKHMIRQARALLKDRIALTE